MNSLCIWADAASCIFTGALAYQIRAGSSFQNRKKRERTRADYSSFIHRLSDHVWR